MSFSPDVEAFLHVVKIEKKKIIVRIRAFIKLFEKRWVWWSTFQVTQRGVIVFVKKVKRFVLIKLFLDQLLGCNNIWDQEDIYLLCKGLL